MSEECVKHWNKKEKPRLCGAEVFKMPERGVLMVYLIYRWQYEILEPLMPGDSELSEGG
jgi:hypothetical protein